jgi:hypothetical protein
MKSPSTLSTSTQPGSPVLTFGVIRSLPPGNGQSLALTDLTLCETNNPIHNAMVSFFNTWRRQMRYQVSGDIEDKMMAARIHPSSQETL